MKRLALLLVSFCLTLSSALGGEVTGVISPVGGGAIQKLAQSAIPVIMAPSGFFANNGVFVIGQAPSSAATVSFSATSGAGVTMTFSAATLLGTSADNGRILTILDTTYKYALITTFSSTTVATATLTGTLSGTGPFANNAIWLTGMAYTTGNTVAFSPPTAVAHANCYMYFPVNSIAAGVAAGSYFAQAVSTTLYTVFNNLIGTGAPTIPSVPTAFVTTGPGAFTQTTGSNVTLATVVVPAGIIGPYGRLHVGLMSTNNNSANTKTQTVTFGGSNVNFTSNTSLISIATDHNLMNLGVTNSQIVTPNNGNGQSSSPTRPAVDTTANVNLLFLGQLANANDMMQYDYFFVEVIP